MSLRFLCILVVLHSATARAQRTSDGDPLLWSWFGRCAHPVRMAVEVRVDARLQQRAVIPFCHLRRGAIERRQYETTLHFQLRGGRTFQDEYTTARAESIDGDIW